MTYRRFALSAVAIALSATAARADVKLPAIFGDNMVLQSDRKVPVWGTAEPGEEVEVRVTASKVTAGDAAVRAEAKSESRRTKADGDGHWKVMLDPLPTTDEPIGFVVTGKNKVSFENVIVGDVWVASGQSNMEMALRSVKDADAEIKKSDAKDVRLFLVQKKVASAGPEQDVTGQWVVCGPQTAGGFSAVAYFFARTLQEATGRPIGLIGTYWGGTPAQAWTSREKLESNETLQPMVESWKKRDEAAVANNKPNDGPNSPHHPAGLYNGMIAPIIPYAIKGAIWYQGESNAGQAYQYRTLFPAMITDWRERWGEGDFPFLFVQLANFMQRKDQPGESAWAELREAQCKTLSLPNTGQAVIIDIGDAKDIHPRNKQDVGKRLALAALKVAYGKDDVVYSGPTLQDAKFADGQATLTFDNVGGGLKAEGGSLKGFAVAGEDRVFHWADAKIEGDRIVVSSGDVAKPVAVRYGWADNPEATLYNADGLPASPFRTDDWPGVTVNNK